MACEPVAIISVIEANSAIVTNFAVLSSVTVIAAIIVASIGIATIFAVIGIGKTHYHER